MTSSVNYKELSRDKDLISKIEFDLNDGEYGDIYVWHSLISSQYNTVNIFLLEKEKEGIKDYFPPGYRSVMFPKIKIFGWSEENLKHEWLHIGKWILDIKTIIESQEEKKRQVGEESLKILEDY